MSSDTRKNMIDAIFSVDSSSIVFIDFEKLEYAYNKFDEFFSKPKLTIQMFDEFVADNFTDEETNEINLNAHLSNFDLWSCNAGVANERGQLVSMINYFESMKSKTKGNFKDLIIVNKLRKGLSNVKEDVANGTNDQSTPEG